MSRIVRPYRKFKNTHRGITCITGTTTDNPKNPKAGLGALLTPDNCALILIDHQPFQFAGLRSHDSQTVINNVVALAKAAKAFNVPTCRCRGSAPGYLLQRYMLRVERRLAPWATFTLVETI